MAQRVRRRRGIVGAAITYYLARAGAQVTLLEREQPGRKTSNNSFAWVNAFSRTTRSYYDFARRSVVIANFLTSWASTWSCIGTGASIGWTSQRRRKRCKRGCRSCRAGGTRWR